MQEHTDQRQKCMVHHFTPGLGLYALANDHQPIQPPAHTLDGERPHSHVAYNDTHGKTKPVPIPRLLSKAEPIHIQPKADTHLLWGRAIALYPLISKNKYPCAQKPIPIPLSPHFQNPMIPMMPASTDPLEF